MNARSEGIFRFIRVYINTHRRAPTHKEIGRACGISSNSVVSYHLGLLAAAGRIEWTRGVARGIALKEEGGGDGLEN